MILSSTTSTLAPLIPFNSIDKDFQFIPQLRAPIEEIRKRDSTSHNIIPIPYSLPIPVPKLIMVPISVPIINTALNNYTAVRTDTFPYGAAPSFLRKFPIGNLRSDPGASYGTFPFEIPISVPIINTVLNNSTTIRTDTFP